ncbi:MAG: glucokinase [Chromatiales bacterium]
MTEAFLVGDIGGTHTRLAHARHSAQGITIDALEVYPSAGSSSFEDLLQRHLERHPGPVAAAGFGFPGPVVDFSVTTTNLPWRVDGAVLENLLAAPVALCNDLEAAADGIAVVPSSALIALQPGSPRDGNRAVIAAGTGLGQAILFRVGDDWLPSASEGGHCDFAPTDEHDVELWRALRARHGHVSYERLVSGPGLVELFGFFAARGGEAPQPWQASEDGAAWVAGAAQSGSSEAAMRALDRFCRLYGAEAGNLALKSLAVGGVYLAGGIAPKLREALGGGGFIEAFHDKGRFRGLMERIPAHIVDDPLLALRGAARAAARRAGIAA